MGEQKYGTKSRHNLLISNTLLSMMALELNYCIFKRTSLRCPWCLTESQRANPEKCWMLLLKETIQGRKSSLRDHRWYLKDATSTKESGWWRPPVWWRIFSLGFGILPKYLKLKEDWTSYRSKGNDSFVWTVFTWSHLNVLILLYRTLQTLQCQTWRVVGSTIITKLLKYFGIMPL